MYTYTEASWWLSQPSPSVAEIGWYFGWLKQIWKNSETASQLLQCEAPKIAKLVYNSNNKGCGTYNYSYWGL